MVSTLTNSLCRNETHYEVNAGADFISGGIDYMRATSGMGISDGYVGTFSCWIKRSSTATSQAPVWLTVDSGGWDEFQIRESEFVDVLQLYIQGNGATDYIIFQTDEGVLGRDDTWHHLLLSWNTNFAADSKICHMYVDDAEVYSAASDDFGAMTLPYGENDWGVSNTIVRTSSAYIDGGVSHMWFDDSFIDLSVKANRRKFITSTHRPVNLGSIGELPTGSQPVIYLRGTGTGFTVNSGSGGNFTATGTLTTPSNSPSTQ